ncbi:PDZ domain-containing protein [Pedobacter sp. SYP-B3415]|uniref:PDZ domain-containing protein n=1 Tax=Pedobacter sp. SYP-B3415 TaxID=2496641 RepID=UPI00101BE786|nr:PDZ domain-containing protein [Pedobacter sp. SYP-B3415]
MIIPIFVNGKGPFDFILDTGVGPMVITNPSILDSALAKNYTPFKIFGLGKGLALDARFTNKIQVEIGRSLSEITPTAVLAEDVFNLSGYVGQPIYGLIGYSFFKSFIVHIRYDSRRLTFYSPNKRVRFKGQKIPIELTLNKPYVQAKVLTSRGDTVQTRLIIDTGGSHALSLEAYQNRPFPLPDSTIEANLGMGLSGVIDGKMGRVKSVSIGTFKLSDVLTGFPNFEDVASKTEGTGRNGNLGANLMKKFNVFFDYNEGFIHLKRNHFFKERSEHDMSGMSVYIDFDHDGRYFAGRIEPASPAHMAGFLPGDELLKINFKPVSEHTLSEIDELFKSRDGRPLLIEINRNGSRELMLLKLRKRI